MQTPTAAKQRLRFGLPNCFRRAGLDVYATQFAERFLGVAQESQRLASAGCPQIATFYARNDAIRVYGRIAHLVFLMHLVCLNVSSLIVAYAVGYKTWRNKNSRILFCAHLPHTRQAVAEIPRCAFAWGFDPKRNTRGRTHATNGNRLPATSLINCQRS